MGIETKTPAMLLDELITAELKRYISQDDDKTRKLRKRIAELVAALDRVFYGNGRIVAIADRTPGAIADELVQAEIDCFMAIDKLHEYSEQDEKVAAGEQAVAIHKLNNRRNELMAAFDNVLGFGAITVTEKTYKGLK